MTGPTEDRPEGQKLIFPPVTPEGLFHQDQLKMKWDARAREIEQTSSPVTSRGDGA